MRMPTSVLVAVAAALGLCLPLAPCAVARGWERPVEGAVLRPFSVGPDRFAAGQHRGVDLAAPPGARVRAACGGRVRFAGRLPRGGRTVSVRCRRLVATYQHLGAVVVRRGEAVRAGARIGTAGRARPRPHVHLGARDASTGVYVDPLALLAGSAPVAPPGLPLAPARRAPPLGPAPPGRAPVRVRPEPVADPLGAWRALPAARPVVPAGSGAGRLPWPVWLGLALVGLGLPLSGGLVRVRRRTRTGRRDDVPGRAAVPRPRPSTY